MANPVRGEYEIELKDGTHTLKYDFQAFATLESLVGFPVTQMGNHLGVNFLLNALMVGLSHEGTRWTIAKLNKAMEPSKFNDYLTVVVRAIAAALGTGGDEEGDGQGEAETGRE